MYLAGLLSGGLWLTLCRLERWRWTAAGAIVLVAAALELTGSRFGLILAVVAITAMIPRLGWRRAAAGAAAMGFGLAVGIGAAAVGSGANATATGRAGEAPVSGIRPRVDTWYSALDAIASRPLVGWGPSGFLSATSPGRSLATARSQGPDVLFADAHNVVVEYGVTTGLPGVALLLAWVLSCLADARRSRERRAGTRLRLHPLAGFALLILAMSLVEPLYVGVTPLAFLALGVAGADGAGTAPAPGTAAPGWLHVWFARAVGLAVISVAVAMTTWMGVGLVALREADVSGDPARAIAATNQLPAWAEPPSVVARLYGFRAITGQEPASAGQARRWWTEAARRDPDDPGRWIDVGQAAAAARDLSAARMAFSRALTRNPWSAKALAGMAWVETQMGRPDLAQPYRRRSAQLLGH